MVKPGLFALSWLALAAAQCDIYKVAGFHFQHGDEALLRRQDKLGWAGDGFVLRCAAQRRRASSEKPVSQAKCKWEIVKGDNKKVAWGEKTKDPAEATWQELRLGWKRGAYLECVQLVDNGSDCQSFALRHAKDIHKLGLADARFERWKTDEADQQMYRWEPANSGEALILLNRINVGTDQKGVWEILKWADYVDDTKSFIDLRAVAMSDADDLSLERTPFKERSSKAETIKGTVTCTKEVPKSARFVSVGHEDGVFWHTHDKNAKLQVPIPTPIVPQTSEKSEAPAPATASDPSPDKKSTAHGHKKHHHYHLHSRHRHQAPHGHSNVGFNEVPLAADPNYHAGHKLAYLGQHKELSSNPHYRILAIIGYVMIGILGLGLIFCFFCWCLKKPDDKPNIVKEQDYFAFAGGHTPSTSTNPIMNPGRTGTKSASIGQL